MHMDTEDIDGVLIINLLGETLDVDNVKGFKKEMEPFLKEQVRVVFDMEQLQFVDSSGLGALLSCLREINESGGDLKLCAMTKSVRTLFELVRMHRVFEIFNTREEAVSSFYSEQP